MRFHMFVCCVNVNLIDLFLSIDVSGTMNFVFFPGARRLGVGMLPEICPM